MTERRYDESEVAAIFARATEVTSSGSLRASSAEGMTLAELQSIGKEVGISADSIALAARTMDVAAAETTRTFLGLPLGVGRTVHLGRTLTDEEWERFVVDLRDTFNARGQMMSHGSLRQWTNGNLQALLEPTATGHRIRLRTMRGGAAGAMTAGLGMIAFSVTSLVAAGLASAFGDVGMLSAMGTIGAAGAAMFASTALRLPRWARTRRQQIEDLSARLAALTTTTAHASEESRRVSEPPAVAE